MTSKQRRGAGGAVSSAFKSDEDIDFNHEAELTKSASSSSRRTSAAAAWCRLGPRRVKLAGLVILTAAMLLGGLQIRRREGAT
jgi:hypothetical protein